MSNKASHTNLTQHYLANRRLHKNHHEDYLHLNQSLVPFQNWIYWYDFQILTSNLVISGTNEALDKPLFLKSLLDVCQRSQRSSTRSRMSVMEPRCIASSEYRAKAFLWSSVGILVLVGSVEWRTLLYEENKHEKTRLFIENRRTIINYVRVDRVFQVYIAWNVNLGRRA